MLLQFNKVSRPEDSTKVENLKLFRGKLKEHQKAGLVWLKNLYDNKLGGILADEMGLGKTIQVISLLALLYEKKIPGPHLIIVPLSTFPNWKSEIEKFGPSLPIVPFYGTSENKTSMQESIDCQCKSLPPIVLSTFETVLSEKDYLKRINWTYIIIDEAQRIKNDYCALK